ncbi:MAG: ribbon-helix-helix domain-containing protein [Proteobacteria bacterium]|nr:ribbon-helix-helix domain-containing protein [Pseudomonadota bacterium]
MRAKKAKQAKVSFWTDPQSVEQLKSLSEHTRVPQSEYWREALADLLHKYGKVLDEIAQKRKRS